MSRLLLRYMLDNVQTYTSIVDDNTFPEQRLPLIAPESLAVLTNTLTLNSDDGLLCFFGDLDARTRRAVIWNPTVKKSVGIDINPNTGYERTVVGFGVCHGDPKLVKISVIEDFDGRPTMWDVDVFSLTTREWRNVHRNMQPFRSCKLECAKVYLNGVIYFRAYDLLQNRSNFFISFNLESGAFGVVPFPENVVHALHVQAAKVNESLGILHYHDGVCDLWTKEEGANEFDRRTVEVEGQRLYYNVLEFRNNGEVVVELDDDNNEESIVAYVPLAGRITGVGIKGGRHTFSARSYMETEHLLGQPESDIIIHINPQHHLLVRYMLDNVQTYTSIVDNNTFPEQRLNLIPPESLVILTDTLTLNSDDGLLCFFGDLDEVTGTAVIWNPTVGRSVGIDITPYWRERTIVGFGVCHGDPKLVKISVMVNPTMWDVDIFSLATREWRNVHRDMELLRAYTLECAKVCLNGVIYFRANDIPDPGQDMSNFFISFDLEIGAFGVVPFPENVVHALHVQAAKVNESLGILHYHDGVCDLWTKEEGANEFDRRYTVEVEGQPLFIVLEFRNNGEVLVELDDDDNIGESRIVAYVPLGPLAGHNT